MSAPILANPPPSTAAENPTGDFDGLPIPPFDPTFFDQHGNDVVDAFSMDTDFMIDDGFDFDLSLDDFLTDPSNGDAVLHPNYFADISGSDPGRVDPNYPDQNGAQFMGNFEDFGNFPGDQVKDTSSPELSGSGVSNATPSSLNQVSGDISGYLNVASPPESNGSNHEAAARVLNCHSPESEVSGNCGSNVSGNSMHSSPNSGMKCGVVEHGFKLEGVNDNNVISKCSSLLKRKKGSDDSDNVSKLQKSSYVESSENVNNDEDEKRKARLIRNRESAQLSRQRKKHYVEELEDKVRMMHSTIQDLNAKISYIMAENATLRTQIGGNGVPSQVPPPPAGMYPHPQMMYPWMPYAPPYMMKPQGSQVPLVPIPKLKPQAVAPSPKSSKKVDKKVKTKKVASISFLGLLFFMLLFGGLVPLVNVRYGGTREPFMSGDSFGSGFYEKHHGRVLAVDGPVNGTGYSGIYGGKDYGSHYGRRDQGISDQPNGSAAAAESVRVGNGSDPLAASLYVPRNDKLVKIDGNLIIHSILASEKAMASQGSADKNNRETGLAVPGDLVPAIPGNHPHLYRSPAVGQRALGNGEKENTKSTMQQWFLEGVAGPLLSSGMCTEVFQFDVSSSGPGAIVPATNARNISMEERQNTTRLNKVRNRRILNGPSMSLSRPSHNISEEKSGRTGKQDNFSGNKSLSSMVVSVLVDPREAGDANGDGMMGPKSLSRIFVVVLIDSVKYVTYSCMLPFKGSAPLVTT